MVAPLDSRWFGHIGVTAASLKGRGFLAAEPENRNEVSATLFADLGARSAMPGMLSAIDEWRPDVILREFQ